MMETPKVTEIKVVRAALEHDPFIDDLRPVIAEHIADIIDLSANVIYLADYKQNAA